MIARARRRQVPAKDRAIRRLAQASCIAAAVVMLGSSTAAASVPCTLWGSPAGYLPHHLKRYHGCSGWHQPGWYQHGNYYVTAYAKSLNTLGDGSCPNLVTVGVTGWNGSQWGQKVGTWAGFGFEVQETLDWYSIVGSGFHHPFTADCVTYSAI